MSKVDDVGVVVPEEKPVVVDVSARVKTVKKGAAGQPDLRMFDVTAINDAITRNMKTLKKDETVAAIAYVDREGAKVAIVGRVKQNKIPGKLVWTVMATREWSGDWGASAAIRWSLK